MNNQVSTTNVKEKRKGGGLRVFLLGLIIALLILVLPGVYLISRGAFDTYIMEKYLLQDMFAQSQADMAILDQNYDAVDIYYLRATQLAKDGDTKQAIAYLDRLIAIAPVIPLAYYERGIFYYRLTHEEHAQSVYLSNLDQALQNVDAAIALYPAEGDYYLLRRDALADKAASQIYQVDRAVLVDLVIESDKKALEYLVDEDRKLLARSLLASDLVDAGRCAEGLELAHELEKVIPPDTSKSYGCLGCAISAGYACLGEMDKAIQSMDALIKNNGGTKSRAYYLALYQYQAGKKDAALQTLNDSLDQDGTFIGARYLLRSLIHLEKGDTTQALTDLQMGENYSWIRSHIYAYVNGKLALANGDTEGTIRWLQLAEASFYPYQSVLRDQVRTELQQLGAQPLDLEPTIEIDVTPTPIP